MNDILAAFQKTNGVIGSAVFDYHYGCQAQVLPAPYDVATISSVLQHVDELSAVNSAISDSDSTTAFVVNFANGTLVLRRVQSVFFVALLDKAMNVSLVNVALNAACIKLGKAAQPFASPSAALGPVPQAPIAAGGERDLTQSVPPRPAARGRRMSPSRIALDMFDNGQIPKDAVGEALVNHLLKTCIHYFGTDALELVRQEFEVMGVTPRTLRVGQVGDLLQALSHYLPDASYRQEFMAAVLGDRSI